MKKSVMVLALGVIFACPQVLFAATIHVPAEQPTIQAGINAAVNGDTVLVAPGVYIGNGNRNLEFFGKRIWLSSSSGPESTIIDCQADSTTQINGLILGNHQSDSVSIAGFTIVNGYKGITSLYSSLILQELHIRNCLSFGIEIQGTEIGVESKVEDCRIEGNNDYGLAIQETWSEVRVSNSTVRSNMKGGILIIYSTVAIDSTDIVDNSGNGISSFSNSTVNMTDVVIDSNNGSGMQVSSESQGIYRIVKSSFLSNNSGGLRAHFLIDKMGLKSTRGFRFDVSDCLFQGNSAVDGGGIFFNQIECYAEIRNCRFIDNTATRGGGISITYAYSGLLIENCLMSNNIADTGGAIFTGGWSYGNDNRLLSCTIVNNEASVASGLFLKYGQSSTLQIDRCIIADGRLGSGLDCLIEPGSLSIECTDIYGNQGGDWIGFVAQYADTNGNICASPLFCFPDTGNFLLTNISTCTPSNNSCSTLIGAYGVGCQYVPHTIYVATTGNDSIGDGSEGNPYKTIQKGIDKSLDNDTIIVGPGIYGGPGNQEINTKAKTILLKSQFGADSTVVSVDSISRRAFIFNHDEDSMTVLDGFKISNQLAGPINDVYGVIACLGSSPKIQNCTIESNTGHYGGGLYCIGSGVIVRDCRFKNNVSGCSICKKETNDSENVKITNDDNAFGPFGGAIYFDSCNASIQNCIFSNNYADGDDEGGGGAVYCINSTISFNKCQFFNNEAFGGPGGAIGGFSSWLVIDSCVFRSNRCQESGGGAIYGQGIITNCAFESNAAGWAGGAVRGTFEVTNCLFAGNNCYRDYAQGGGAFYGHGNILRSTFVNNQSCVASALLLDSISVVENCLIAENRNYPNVECYPTTSAISGCGTFSCTNIFNNEGGDWVGCISGQANVNGNISADPLFCYPDTGNYHLYNISPCAPQNNSCGVLMGAFDVGCQFDLTGHGIENESIMNVLDHTPNIYWSYPSNPPVTQDSFNLAVGNDPDWTYSELWNPSPVASSDTFVTYAGLPLNDGQTYFYRLRVHNGAAWSNWHESSFRMNSIPQVPVTVSPIEEQSINTPTVNLNALKSIDAEGDQVSYDFEVDKGGTLVASGYDLLLQGDTVTWMVNSPLSENDKFNWKVRAYDQFEHSNWSLPQSFWVNLTEEPPLAFLIYRLPLISNTYHNMKPKFSWMPAQDPDPLDSVKYIFLISIDSLFQFAYEVDELFDTVYSYADSLQFGTKYWWKVKAVDKTGRYLYSDTQGFRTWKLGDANGDWVVNILDVTFLISALYKGGNQPLPTIVGDVNGNCVTNILDATYLIAYLYKSGASPRVGCE